MSDKNPLERRRTIDPITQSLFDRIEALAGEVRKGFERSDTRIDHIYTEVGKINGMNEKINSFIQLMERVEERAAGDVSELKSDYTKLVQRVAKLEGTDIKNSAQSNLITKVLDGAFGRFFAPIATAAIVAFFITKNAQPPESQININPPVLIAPQPKR